MVIQEFVWARSPIPILQRTRWKVALPFEPADTQPVSLTVSGEGEVAGYVQAASGADAISTPVPAGTIATNSWLAADGSLTLTSISAEVKTVHQRST